MSEIKQTKGLSLQENVLDRMGSSELAANYFRATQTKDKLEREQVQGDRQAQQTHQDVGEAVRATIKDLGGTMPEDHLPEPPIKEIQSKVNQLERLLPEKN